MKNGYKLGLAAVAGSIALVGCGGGSSAGTPLVSGNLFNTYVEGATYVCSSGATGTTDNMGTYTCNVGDTVEFFLGNYSIGTADAAAGILDTNILSADDAADKHLLRLLDGIDGDVTDGVITIPQDFTALDEVTSKPGDAEFETQIEGTSVTLADETTAVNNHAESLLKVYLADKTFYTAEQDNFLKSVSFDTNLTEMNTIVIAGTGEGNIDATQPILENGGLQVPGLGFLVLTEKTEDYLLFSYNADQTIKFYVDEAQAQTVFYPYIPMTTAMLSGKVFYADNSTDFEMISFISASEVIFREILLDTNGSILVDTGANSYPYTINSSGEVIITFGDWGTSTYKLIDTTDTQWNMVNNGNANSPYSTWLLNAPSNFPVLEPTPEPTVTPTTFVSGKSFDIGSGMILTFGSDYSFSDNEGCTGTWSEVTSNSIAVTGSCEFDITFNGELVDGVAVTVNVTDVNPAETFNTTFTEVTSSTTLTPTADLLRSKLSGSTYYGAGDGNIIEELVFNPEVTSLTWTEVVGGTGASASETLSLDGMVLTYVSAGNEQVTFTEITDTYLVYSFDGGAGTSRWFTTQAEAQAYFGIQ